MDIILVDELTAEWTEKERKELKDLIEDCRKREQFLLKVRVERGDVKKTADSLRALVKNLQALSDRMAGDLAEQALRKVGDVSVGKA